MKIKISKNQWEKIGRVAKWVGEGQHNVQMCEECGDVILNYRPHSDPIEGETLEEYRDRQRVLCDKCRHPRTPDVSNRGGTGHYHAKDDMSGASSSWDNTVKLYENSTSKKTVKISKSQWEKIGRIARFAPPDVSPEVKQEVANEFCSVCGGAKGNLKDASAKVKWDQYHMCQKCQDKIMRNQ